LADDASHPSQDAQATPRTAELREFVAELAAKMAVIQAQLDRQQRVRDILDDAGYPAEPPPPRKPKRDRHGLRVIPGGLAALVPLAMPGHGAAALVPAAQVWLSRRNWPRWAVAAVALGLAGATAVPAAAGVPDPPAVTCAHQCAAGEGGGQPLTGRIMIRHDLGRR